MSKVKLLIADDCAEIRCLCQDAVYGLGLDVIEANNGKKAWSAIEAEHPDILILQDNLAEISGFMICQWLRSQGAKDEAQVIMTLSDHDRQYRVSAYEVGVDITATKPFNAKEIRALTESAIRSAKFRHMCAQRQEIEENYRALSQTNEVMIQGWTRALDLRDRETEGHSVRVTEMTTKLAYRMGFREPELTDIRYGALLHDIGKIGIPDRILHKESELNAEELEEMQRHPEYAFSMLRDLEHLKYSLSIPHLHHEQWDGSGYPLGLSGEEIPLPARIFSVVDVFDALTSHRSYKCAWTYSEAFDEILRLSGTQFDPQVVHEFIMMMTEETRLTA